MIILIKMRMIGVLKVLVIVVAIFLMVGGLVVSVISNARHAAQLMKCHNNLRQIALACQDYHDFNLRFPRGTVSNAALPPDKRLSWLTEIWPTFMCGGIKSLLDKTKPWDDETNCPVRCRIRVDIMSGTSRQEPMGDVNTFMCPANPAR